MINFECSDIAKVEKEFRNAVDDYLEFCAEVGKEPDKEYKGTFHIRISPELHRRLAMKAFQNGESLNATVERALAAYLTERQDIISLEETVSRLQKQLELQNKAQKESNYYLRGQSYMLHEG